MKKQFTKGPWLIKDYDQNQFEVGTENIVVAAVLNDVVELENEAEANAKLISAAPDLLEACMKAYEYRSLTHHGDDKCLAILKSAIEKAIV